MTPRVSVLIAVYDGADYIREAVGSIIGQTFTDFELLIVDDGSTDETADLVEAFDDSRIRLLRNELNIGQVASLNRGLREAKGEIVARLDHDDVCDPRRLELQVDELDRDSRVGLVGSWIRLVDGDDRAIGSVDARIDNRIEFIYWTLVQYVLISHPAAMFRRDAVLEVGGYDETMGPAEDKDLWRKLMLAGWDARIVPEVLVRYRVHDAQLSQTRNELQRANDDRSQERLLAELAPGRPERLLRLLLSGDLAIWEELTPDADLPDALDALVDGAATRLGLDAIERQSLRRLLAGRVEEVVRSGWRRNRRAWRAAAPELVTWAGGKPRQTYVLLRLAPVLRPVGGLAGRATGRAAHLRVLAGARARLRRSQGLRRAYARVTRGTIDR